MSSLSTDCPSLSTQVFTANEVTFDVLCKNLQHVDHFHWTSGSLILLSIKVIINHLQHN